MGNESVGITLVAKDMASGPISAVRKELQLLGPAGSLASSGIGLTQRIVAGASGALTHFAGTIKGLITGPLGILGLGAGIFTLGGALKTGIDTASNMAIAIEKLTGVTGDNAEQMSGLLAVMNKFGVDTDTATTRIGFLEKTLGTIGNDAKAAAKLQTDFGFSVTDSKGRVLDANDVFLKLADYMTGSATAADKAALAAKLLGRGYIDLVPILDLGSKGIQDAEAAAASLGLTLTASNVQDLKAYQETMRETGDAVSGLELQLSLALVPAIKDVAQAATSFIGQNRAGIITFFKGLIADSRTAAAFITGTIVPDLQSLAGAALGFWNGIPPQLRDLIVKGFIADKAIKFLFGFDPATTIGSVISSAIAKGMGNVLGNAAGGVAGGLLARGSSPANPLWVQMVGGTAGLPGGEGATAAEGAGAAAGGSLVPALALALAPLLAIPIAAAINESNPRIQAADTASYLKSQAYNEGSMAQRFYNSHNASSGGTGGNVGQDQYGIPPSDSGGTGGLVGSDQYSNLGGAALALAGALQKATGWAGTWTKSLQDSEKAIHGALFGKPSTKQGEAADTLAKYLQSVSSAYFKTPQSIDQLNRDISTLQRDQTAATKAGNTTLATKLGQDISVLQQLKTDVSKLKLNVTVNTQTTITARTINQEDYYSQKYGHQVHVE